MTSRPRKAFTNIVSQENTKNVKSLTNEVPTQPTRRAALSEIGNNVNASRAIRAVNKTSGATKAPKEPIIKAFGAVLVNKIIEKPAIQAQKEPIAKQPIVKQSLTHPVGKIIEKAAIQAPQPLPKKEPTVIYTVDNDNEEPLKKEPEAFSSDLLAPNAPIEDVDAIDGDNPALVSNYSNDIYNYLRTLEKQYTISQGFLKGQYITAKMRSTLVDWLIDVHQEFKLFQETLYLTIALIDRFLQVDKTTTRKKLQLVGVTAMFIASKYEEVHFPDISDFVYITDNAYKKSEIVQMEVMMLQALDFSLGRPLPLHFLRRYSKAGRALPVHHAMAKYFLELSLVQYELSHHPPSLISAAALYLSFLIIGDHKAVGQVIWTNTLVHYSTYTMEDLLPIVYELASMVVNVNNSKYQAVRRKFSHADHMRISLRPELKSPSILALTKK